MDSGVLDPGRTYYWKVIAININGSAEYPGFAFFTDPADDEDDPLPDEDAPAIEFVLPSPFAAMEYKMISVPAYPVDPDPMAVFGGTGKYNKRNIRLFRYDSND